MIVSIGQVFRSRLLSPDSDTHVALLPPGRTRVLVELIRMAAGYIWVVILLGVLCSPAASQNGNQYCNELVEAGQHGEELTAACDFALLLSERLPNFVCKELTKRFDNPTG